MSGTFKDFWDKNYQWVLGTLGVIFTWVISGLIGFYTALSAVDTKIDALRDRVTKAETKLSSAEGDIKSLSSVDKRLQTLEVDFKYVKTETERMTSTNSSIHYLIEVERAKTVNDLKEILNKK